MEESNALIVTKQGFRSKMNASLFFFKNIKLSYVPGRSTKLPNEFFYFIDAVIFELHSASQLLLQIINLKSGLNEAPEKVRWSPSFQKKLKKKSGYYFDWWGDFDNSPQAHVLEATRHHIAHRGENFLYASVNDLGFIDVVSLTIRWRYRNGKPFQIPSGRSIEVLDELQDIISFLEKKYKEIVWR